MANKKQIYGYGYDGRPLHTQQEVIRNYFLTHPGRQNALSHESCKTKFGFTRLSAIVHLMRHRDFLDVRGEEIEVPTRYEGITSRPTFYWVEKEEAEAFKKSRES